MVNQRKKILVEIFRDIMAPKLIEKLNAEKYLTREQALSFFLEPLEQMEISDKAKRELERLAKLEVNKAYDKIERQKAGNKILYQLGILG